MPGKPARKPAPEPVALPEPPLFQFRTFAEIQELFGLSKDALSALAEEKDFPVFTRKISPVLMLEWLSANRGRLKDIKARD